MTAAIPAAGWSEGMEPMTEEESLQRAIHEGGAAKTEFIEGILRR